MDKRTVLDRLGAEGEERLLLSRVWDKWQECSRKNLPAVTVFLSPAQQMATRRMLSAAGVQSGYVFYGGYPGAQRCQLHFLPDWQEEPEQEAIRAIRCTWYREEEVNHRDLLGSLMGLGLTREVIGDILVGEHQADVLVSASVADFLLTGWDSAGHARLHCAPLALEDVIVPEEKTKLIRDTVASLRLDSVVSSAISISRGRAAEAIAAGRVQLNWQECTKCDRTVGEGDVISLRGLGKCTVESVGGQTRKGRLSISIKRYV